MHLFRAMLAFILIGASYPSLSQSNAQEKANETFILIRLTMAEPPTVGTTRPRITLADYHSDFKKSIYLKDALQLVQINAGHYYIQKMVAGFLNTPSPDIAKRESISQTIEVQAGTITYVGDFHIDKKLALQIKHTPASLKEALQDETIPRNPLRVAGFGRKPIPLTWD